jgi:hypothetical protein
MAWLKIYQAERNDYPEIWKAKMPAKKSVKYLKKLCRHFKVKPVMMVIHYRKRGGGFYRETSDNTFYWKRYPNEFETGKGLQCGLIVLPSKTDLGTVCHEFTHHLTRWKFGQYHHHDKKFKHCLKLVFRYAYRKNWIMKEPPNCSGSPQE